MSEPQILRQESQCSFEFGKASSRHKIYYNSEEEAKQKIQTCKNIEGLKSSLFPND